MAKTKEILVNGQLTPVTEFDHSAQEIDDAVDGQFSKALNIKNVRPSVHFHSTDGNYGGSVGANTGHLWLEATNEKGNLANRRILSLLTSANSSGTDVKNALLLQDIINGVMSQYYLLHSGNVADYAAAAKVEDISSLFTVTDNTSSATVMAYRFGNMVFVSASITPTAQATAQNKPFVVIPAGYKPSANVALSGSLVVDATNVNTEIRNAPAAAYVSGYMSTPNQGGYSVALTTKSRINMIGFWKIGG